MSSFNGLKKIAATDIQNSGRFYLGNQLDTGTVGQALVSAGPNEPARWDTHTGTIQPLTMGTDLSLASGNTTFDGSIPDTINASGGSTYQGGKNISIDTTTTLDTINLDTTIEDADLSSSTNVIPGAVLATKVQRSYFFRSFTNLYAEYSTNFRTSFKAQSDNVMVEFRAIIRADNKVFYGGLYDYNASAYIADTRNRFNYNDETDQDFTVLTWWMRNLTPGNTYYISPYFRGSTATVYIYAGHNGSTDFFAAGIMRIIDGGNNVNIY